MNPERLVVGLAVAFGTPGRNGRVWRLEQFVDFVASGHTAALAAYRHPVDPYHVTADESFGVWRAFATVPEGSTPAGVLALGEIEQSVKGDRLLADIAETLNPWGGGDGVPWGLSAGTVDASPDESDAARWIGEVTITKSPAHESPRLIAAGPYAGDVWRLLTGREVPHVVTAVRPLRRRLLGAFVNGTPIWGEE